ncbi:putative Binding-protein-dependent transport systems inner membrane component [Paraburkholderia piptadeniae]|uniref:Binding-protein-dependent transport systems inner membrane component n=1 Tax=Paraburkholderia piptadeniae TaxID=1701573 RepID=A0A1N7S0A4_9BURK|nr:ABC transporter permease [Paraburkholderia piptadeniae]SIT40751.1 putative Binding-protein-dependent transport systems inner membrane component [Paraburkholderia piptadeniae]
MHSKRWRYGIAPLIVAYLIFFVFPQFTFLVVSVFRSTGPGSFDSAVTFANYAAIASDGYFTRAIVNTLELSALTGAASVVLAFPVAYAIAHSPRLGRPLFALVVGVMFSSAVALALGWQTLLGSNGAFNRVLLGLGVIASPLPLGSNFAAIAVGTIHGAVPVAVLGLLPACEAIPARQLEASTGLGASQWRTFWSVIVPQTYRSALSIALIVFATTTSIFTTPALLGGGRVALVSLAIRDQLLTVFDYPRSAALSAVLIVLTLAVTALARLVIRSRRAKPTLAGAAS